MNIYKIQQKASRCRAFEEVCFNYIRSGHVKCPTYLSAGQEYTPSFLSCLYEDIGVQPLIFGQHRCHSIYISFGGKIEALIDELLGLGSGCAGGMGGSASIHSPEIKMFGHDGMMGSNVPIGVGACFASKRPTVIFVGDAAGEEDYALASYGWAKTREIPVLFVVEDNNLSILTEKKVRRSWGIDDVAKSMGLLTINADNLNTDHYATIRDNVLKGPILLNVNVNRTYWHAGAGSDKEVNDTDKYSEYKEHLIEMEELWKSRLETQSKT